MVGNPNDRDDAIDFVVRENRRHPLYVKIGFKKRFGFYFLNQMGRGARLDGVANFSRKYLSEVGRELLNDLWVPNNGALPCFGEDLLECEANVIKKI